MNAIGISYGPASGLIYHVTLNYPGYQIVVNNEEEKAFWLKVIADIKGFANTDIICITEQADARNRVYVNCLDQLPDSIDQLLDVDELVVFEWHHLWPDVEKRHAYESKGITNHRIDMATYGDSNKKQVKALAESNSQTN